MKRLKEVDYKGNIGYILYLICINAYIVWSWWECLGVKYIEEASNIVIDGTDFTGLANMTGLVFNNSLVAINFILVCMFFLIFIPIVSLIFNKLYFRKIDTVEKEKKINDIAIITLLISLLTVIGVVVVIGWYVVPYTIVVYIIYVVIIYLLAKARIVKLYKSGF